MRLSELKVSYPADFAIKLSAFVQSSVTNRMIDRWLDGHENATLQHYLDVECRDRYHKTLEEMDTRDFLKMLHDVGLNPIEAKLLTKEIEANR